MASVDSKSLSHGVPPAPAVRFLAHHFGNQAQQFDAGKLGMWLFLVQEVLFFSGLFCAYAIYRSNHPDIFAYADHFLDRNLGAINTGVLIFSSFTMAWAVRSVQLNQRRLAVFLLGITFLCACGFLGIKFVEYRHKWHDGLLWGSHYAPVTEALEHAEAAEGLVPPRPAPSAAALLNDDADVHYATPQQVPSRPHPVPKNVHIFFGIYFAMTGLHGIHVLIGMGIILWMMRRTWRGDFSAEYFGPMEFTGLYWHLVDLVWIYLFPLLYLIH
jgi:cytochrome c oxidase subunit 3